MNNGQNAIILYIYNDHRNYIIYPSLLPRSTDERTETLNQKTFAKDSQ
jgi:hypothetical protein